MSKVKDENYYQISGWMVNRLGLKGAELQIFAIIYGFSQDGESWFNGSLSYLEEWLGVSKPTVIKALKELVNKEYIIKDTADVNSVTFNRYKANLPVVNFTGSKDSLLGSKKTLHNNDNYNNTNISSKDDILDKGCSTRPETPQASSGKLFSSQKSQTRKSSVQKTNSFITTCQREAVKKEFPQQVLDELNKYFIMLAEMNCLLPSVSIEAQLTCLAKVPRNKQIEVIKNTVSRGWKSLQYASQDAIAGKTPRGSFVDTASPNTFKATPEEDKNGDWKNEIPEDHIF